MDYMKEYTRWLASDVITAEERAELESIADNKNEIESRFFSPLQFGTAGLRGVLGAGIYRMNTHTVAQATQGLATLILTHGAEACKRGVAISYDCRICSDLFAKISAQVLAGNGIRVLLFDAMRPTPELSFAVLRYHTIAGINITASHNPKEYNGYKVYWEDGAQLPPAEADTVAREIEKTDIFNGAKLADFDRAVADGTITYLGAETDEEFLSNVMSQAIDPKAVEAVADEFSVVYTPFHGTGYRLVPEALRRLGLKKLICQPDQMVPDGTFSSVKSPNPENMESFALAIDLARENKVDVIVGTDPDADRVGVVARSANGEYICLTGNQTGILLLDYIINARKSTGTMPEKPAFIKTIVTSEMPRAICNYHDVECADVFTGFKFIAEKIREFEPDGKKYLLGFEESYGYLVGDYARDKDAVTATMLIVEMAAKYHAAGMTLVDALESLYQKYGYYAERTVNVMMPGVNDLADMKRLMESLRNDPPKDIRGVKVTAVRDYLTAERREMATGAITKTHISGSNVLYFELEDGSRFIIRPSGTEPKIKIYLLISGADHESCAKRVELLSDGIDDIKGRI